VSERAATSRERVAVHLVLADGQRADQVPRGRERLARLVRVRVRVRVSTRVSTRVTARVSTRVTARVSTS